MRRGAGLLLIAAALAAAPAGAGAAPRTPTRPSLVASIAGYVAHVTALHLHPATARLLIDGQGQGPWRRIGPGGRVTWTVRDRLRAGRHTFAVVARDRRVLVRRSITVSRVSGASPPATTPPTTTPAPTTPAPTTADDWPGLRGDAGETGYLPSPTVAGTDAHLAWTAPSATHAAQSPAVIAGGRTFVVGPDADVIEAYAISDGTHLWTADLRALTSWRASASDLMTHGGLVYVGASALDDAGHGGIVALHAADGTLAWTYVDTHDGGDAAYPGVVQGDTLVTAFDTGLITGLDAATGAERWHDTSSADYPSPPVALPNGQVALELVNGTVSFVNAADGAMAPASAQPSGDHALPVAWRGDVIVPSSTNARSGQLAVYAENSCRAEPCPPTRTIPLPFRPWTTVVAGDTAVMSWNDPDAPTTDSFRVTAVDLVSGATLWTSDSVIDVGDVVASADTVWVSSSYGAPLRAFPLAGCGAAICSPVAEPDVGAPNPDDTSASGALSLGEGHLVITTYSSGLHTLAFG
ncbi:PQQ-binding-like beta-propeller repeat protein [Humibacter sp.]|uniref:outer membrane protein assembly factor BamB family protein n=1 Tax=Humibacter sp. TaxID=1940291 RepID=UPI002C6E51A3|nr:PQQ-binding-like beta-propeller repeat protein [Humibacter sp.]HVX09146.1 PQQ-binding-like beta-propeller repeat protein [Humibacter sp.]